jgi:HK97 family phage major capsid protein
MSNYLDLVLEARGIIQKADREGREMTAEEYQQAERLLNRATDAKSLEAQMAPFNTRPEGEVTMTDPRASVSSSGPGDVFVASKGFKSIADPGTRGQRWSTGAIPVGDLHTKGTLLLGTGAPGMGTGGGLVPVPQVVGGVVETLFQPIAVTDLIPSSQTSVGVVRYINEGTATNAAAGVAEGGVKPESTLGLSTVDEQAKKIATVLVTSDELLEDGGNSVQSYLNSRLSLFVRLEEERQLLRGSGGSELTGIFGRSGIHTYARGTVDNNAVAILRAIAGNRGSTNLEPDGIVMHPDNWLTTRLLTDSAGQFFGGGPYQGQYGNGMQTRLFGDTLWGKRVVLSSHVGVGTALVGCFGTAAHVYRRGGATLEVTNSHSDHFVRNLMAIRAEERLALAIYRESSFVQVTGLS